jgi:hypothetical protein
VYVATINKRIVFVDKKKLTTERRRRYRTIKEKRIKSRQMLVCACLLP